MHVWCKNCCCGLLSFVIHKSTRADREFFRHRTHWLLSLVVWEHYPYLGNADLWGKYSSKTGLLILLALEIMGGIPTPLLQVEVAPPTPKQLLRAAGEGHSEGGWSLGSQDMGAGPLKWNGGGRLVGRRKHVFIYQGFRKNLICECVLK